MSALAQLAFEFPEHTGYHDSTQWGFFSMLTQPKHGQKIQKSYQLNLLPTVIKLADPTIDSWLSQAEFCEPNRRVVNLLRLSLHFVDIDCYKLPWAQGKSPDKLAAGVLSYCESEGIPQPSVIVFSGRGVQVKWLLEGTLPRQALPRWNAVQRELVERLKPLGADPQARDASRVLRLVNTVNTKSGQMCHVVHVSGSTDEPQRYSFEYLCECILPVARWSIVKKPVLRVIEGGKKPSSQSHFSRFSLNWARLEDLRTIVQLRGGVAEGERMKHLFWQLNFLVLSGATHSRQLWHEAAMLASKIDKNWCYGSAELSTLYAKAKAHNAGETVTFAGKRWSPLYTPRNDTLIDIFEITDSEQAQLKTLISSDVMKSRDAAAARERRRAAGAVSRSDYESSSLSKTKPWEAMGISRRTWYRKFGTSPSL